MNRMTLLGQRLMARDPDRQVAAALQVRLAVMDGRTALGIPVTEAAGSGPIDWLDAAASV